MDSLKESVSSDSVISAREDFVSSADLTPVSPDPEQVHEPGQKPDSQLDLKPESDDTHDREESTPEPAFHPDLEPQPAQEQTPEQEQEREHAQDQTDKDLPQERASKDINGTEELANGDNSPDSTTIRAPPVKADHNQHRPSTSSSSFEVDSDTSSDSFDAFGPPGQVPDSNRHLETVDEEESTADDKRDETEPENDDASQSMSRRSVLEAFESDIRDLLLLQHNPNSFVDLRFEDGNFSEQTAVEGARVGSAASVVSDPSPTSAPVDDSTTNNVVNPTAYRNSRSTISSSASRADTDSVSTLEDQVSPLRRGNSFRHRRDSSKVSAHSVLQGLSDRNKGSDMLPPSIPPPMHDDAVSVRSVQPLRKLGRMSSDLEQRLKRGRLSLRRKSTATLKHISPLDNTDSPMSSQSMSEISRRTEAIMSLFSNTHSSPLAAEPPKDGEKISLWFLHQIVCSKTHATGAYLTQKLCVPNELWNMDNVTTGLLETRVKCLRNLTEVGSEHLREPTLITVDNLQEKLDALELSFSSGFSVPLTVQSPEPAPPAAQGEYFGIVPRRMSTLTSLSPSLSHAGTVASNNASITAGSRTSGVFRRLRKKSVVTTTPASTTTSTASTLVGSADSESSEPTTPATDPYAEKTRLDHYLSSISSLAKALESLDGEELPAIGADVRAEWLKRYRSFVGHTACRLILKDVATLVELYSADVRELVLTN